MVSMELDKEAVDCFSIKIINDVVSGNLGVDLDDAVIFGAVVFQVPDANNFRSFDDITFEDGHELQP